MKTENNVQLALLGAVYEARLRAGVKRENLYVFYDELARVAGAMIYTDYFGDPLGATEAIERFCSAAKRSLHVSRRNNGEEGGEDNPLPGALKLGKPDRGAVPPPIGIPPDELGIDGVAESGASSSL